MLSRGSSPMFFITIAILLINLNLIGCGSSSNTDQHPSEVLELSAKFKKTMISCPDRIWSDYNWEGLKVVFVYPSLEKSRIWDVSLDRIEMVSTSRLPTPVILSLYHFFQWGGKPAMSLNMELDEPLEGLFLFGVHEFFHNQGQKGWEKKQQFRTMSYPYEWEPRLYRRMVFDNLKYYMAFEDPEYLRRARYWFDKWSEHSYELMSTTDGYEGTAFYVEVLAQAIAAQGCSTPDDVLKAHVLEKVHTEFGHPVSGQAFASDKEGYEIGGLAAMILRFQRGNLNEWNLRMADGDTPLEVLLEDVIPLEEEAPLPLIELFEETGRRSNEEVGKLVNEEISRLDDVDFVRLVGNPNFIQSNFSPTLTLRLIDKNMDLFDLGSELGFLHSQSASDYVFKKDSVIFGYPVPLCPSGYLVTLVPQDSINLVNGVADVSTDSVEGRIEGQIIVDENGFHYFCVE